MAERLIDRIWWDESAIPRVARATLTPLGAAYLAVARLRNWLFDTGRLKATQTPIPVASIGNLTAGGTGKTPVSAWIANAMRERGASPAIVMRGYGGDEAAVHGVLTPGTPVITAGSRAVGIWRARREFGCDVAVLDDAFQHRWVSRAVDIVLLSAEETVRTRRGLPAGPWREPLSSVRRATLAIVTRKTASDDDVDAVVRLIGSYGGALPVAVISLIPDRLTRPASEPSSEQREPIASLAGENVLVVAAIGNARAFVAQVGRYARTARHALYADHHAFSTDDVKHLVHRARGVDRVVCTLKDFVKLRPLWPESASPLWYVSQQVIIERGAQEIERQLSVLLGARPTDNEPAGLRRPSPDIHGN